jgi:hypothetical protein
MVVRYVVSASLLVVSVLSLSACQKVKNTPTDMHDNAYTTNTTNTTDALSVVEMGYKNWYKNVLNSKTVINTDKNKIESLYNTIHNFNKKSVTTGWLDDVSTKMAKNSVYYNTILNRAKQDKLAFAKSLLSRPQDSIQYHGASEALSEGLKHIEKYDYQYRILSTAFEDSARGRTKKTLVNGKNIGIVSLKQYTSKNNTPSVAEQLLTIAAIKILNLHDSVELQTAYNKLLSNIPIESCLGHAQRNSAQCKAASYDKNDLSFCMAKHAIGETAQCFSWILP